MGTIVNGRDVLTDPRLAAPVWDDVLFPAQSVNPPGAVSDPVWDATNVGWSFADGADKMVQIVAQLPHSYMAGGDLYFHLHWCPTSTNTGAVVWRLNYRWYNNGTAVGTFSDNVDLSATPSGTAHVVQIDSWPAISKSDARISSLIDIKITRVGTSDAYTGAALLKEFDIHYPVDSMGSDQVGSKS